MPEPHKVEEEGEDSLLCDPEEMDLLGEIFDTLSSRSSHDRGLLYGTRSLDLFGLDSHDFIMKVRRSGSSIRANTQAAVLTHCTLLCLPARLSGQSQSGEPVSVHQWQWQPAQLESGNHRGALRSDRRL